MHAGNSSILVVMIGSLLVPLLALGAGVSESTADVSNPQTPSPTAIVAAVVARDAQTQKELKSMQYDQRVQTDHLDEDGKVTQHQDLQLIVRPGADPEIQVVSLQTDHVPDSPEKASEQAKAAEDQQRQQNFDLKSIAARFNLSVQGESTELGARAYVIVFEPKPNQTYDTQVEKVLNQLHGRIWVRASDDTILRTDAHLLEPVSVAWFLASVDKLDFHYELPPGGSEFGPAWLETSFVIKAPLITFAQHQRIDLTNFRSRSSKSSQDH
jgi:hypothetical protein